MFRIGHPFKTEGDRREQTEGGWPGRPRKDFCLSVPKELTSRFYHHRVTLGFPLRENPPLRDMRDPNETPVTRARPRNGRSHRILHRQRLSLVTDEGLTGDGL